MDVRVCDVCNNRDRPAYRYQLVRDDSTIVTIDLCGPDTGALPGLIAAALEHVDLVAVARPDGVRPSGRGRPANRKTMTLEQIEASKQG